jgi:hypothetical protein
MWTSARLRRLHLMTHNRILREEVLEVVREQARLSARLRESIKRFLQVGDVVRNRLTREAGPIVRIYSDLLTAMDGKATTAYIVRLPVREVLWQKDEVEFTDLAS